MLFHRYFYRDISYLGAFSLEFGGSHVFALHRVGLPAIPIAFAPSAIASTIVIARHCHPFHGRSPSPRCHSHRQTTTIAFAPSGRHRHHRHRHDPSPSPRCHCHRVDLPLPSPLHRPLSLAIVGLPLPSSLHRPLSLAFGHGHRHRRLHRDCHRSRIVGPPSPYIVIAIAITALILPSCRLPSPQSDRNCHIAG